MTSVVHGREVPYTYPFFPLQVIGEGDIVDANGWCVMSIPENLWGTERKNIATDICNQLNKAALRYVNWEELSEKQERANLRRHMLIKEQGGK